MEDAWKERIKQLRAEILELRRPKSPRAEAWEKKEGTYSPVANIPNSKQDVWIPHESINDVEFGRPGQLLARTKGLEVDPAMVIWDYLKGKVTHYIDLEYRYNLGACMDTFEGKLAAVCGMDTYTKIYSLPEYENQAVRVEEPTMRLQGHIKAVTSCAFPNTETAISTSLDGDLRLWDLHEESCIRTFRGHVGDVNCCATSKAQPNIFLTGAMDFTARIWDSKSAMPSDEDEPSGCVGTFDVDSREVNDVDFFPDGNSFATALNNTQVQVYDRRASCKLLSFLDPSTFRVANGGAEKVKFSPSGRLMFVQYGVGKVLIYDVAGEVIDLENEFVQGAAITTALKTLPLHRGDAVTDLAIEKQEGTIAVVASPSESKGHAKLFWPGKGKSQLVTLGKTSSC